MKLSTLAKTSLALGILTTGLMTTYAQSANAADDITPDVENVNKDNAFLHSYYKQAFYELNNVTGVKEGKQLKFKTEYGPLHIQLPESEVHKYTDGEVKNLDVFAIREYNDTKLPSIGGITQNNTSLQDNPIEPKTILKKANDQVVTDEDIYFPIHKQHVSLKEIDFKLRQQLVDHDGLYTNGYKKGKIIVSLKGNKQHEIDLSDKFPVSKMGIVIDATQIDHIYAEMRA